MILWFYDFMILWFYDFMKNGGGGTKIWSLDNWQSLRPITLWGSVKKSELINYKGWQWVQRDSVQTTFSSEWRGGTVPETWPVSDVLWPCSAPLHKLWSKDIHWVEETGSQFSSHLIRVHIAHICKLYLHLHAFANCFCILFINKLCAHDTFFAQIC